MRDYEISELNTKIIPALKGLGAKFKGGGSGISDRLSDVYAALGTEALGPALEELRLKVFESKLASSARREVAGVIARGRSIAGAKLDGLRTPKDVKDALVTVVKDVDHWLITGAQRHTVPVAALATEVGRRLGGASKQVIATTGSTATDVGDRIQSTAAGFGLDIKTNVNVEATITKVGPPSEEVRQQLEATAAEIEEALGRVAPALSGAHQAIEISVLEVLRQICTIAVEAGKHIQATAAEAAEEVRIIASRVRNVTSGPRERAHAFAGDALRRARPVVAAAGEQLQTIAAVAGQKLRNGFRSSAMANLSVGNSAKEARRQIQATIALAAMQIRDAVGDVSGARSEVRQRVQDFATLVHQHLDVFGDEVLEAVGLERRQVPLPSPEPEPSPKKDNQSRTPLTMLLIALVVAIWAGFAVAVGQKRAPSFVSRWLSSWRRSPNTIPAKVVTPRPSGALQGIGGS